MIRYIPPVDTKCNSTYAGRYHVSPQWTSTTPDMMRTNPKCPSTLCKPCAGPNCTCNLNHMAAPQLRQFFKYSTNMY
jgi:hypothetical protein